jgi:flagellar FliJ protein
MSTDGNSERLRWTAAARAASSSTLGDLEALASETDRQIEEADAQLAETRARTITLEKLEARHEAAEFTESLRQEQIALDEISLRPADPTGKRVAP